MKKWMNSFAMLVALGSSVLLPACGNDVITNDNITPPPANEDPQNPGETPQEVSTAPSLNISTILNGTIVDNVAICRVGEALEFDLVSKSPEGFATFAGIKTVENSDKQEVEIFTQKIDDQNYSHHFGIKCDEAERGKKATLVFAVEDTKGQHTELQLTLKTIKTPELTDVTAAGLNEKSDYGDEIFYSIQKAALYHLKYVQSEKNFNDLDFAVAFTDEDKDNAFTSSFLSPSALTSIGILDMAIWPLEQRQQTLFVKTDAIELNNLDEIDLALRLKLTDFAKQGQASATDLKAGDYLLVQNAQGLRSLIVIAETNPNNFVKFKIWAEK